MLVGIGENAGVVDVGDGWAVTFKVESHNHPRYVEPYQGAATGVGGIVRDILAMGARPVAVHGLAAVRPGRRPRHRAGAARRGAPVSAATATAWACPTSAARCVFDASLRGQPAGQRAVRRRAAARGPARWPTPSGVGQQGRPVRCAHRPRRHRRGLGAGLARPSRRRGRRPAKKLPVGPGRRPVHREGADRVLPRALRRRPGRSASRTSAAPACPARPASWPRPATAACAIDLDTVPLRANGMTAGRDPVQRVAGAHVRGRRRRTTSTRSWPSARKWDVLATVIGEVTDGDRLRDHLARRDGRRRAAAHRGPRRPGLRAADGPARHARTRCRPTLGAARPSPATSCARTVLRWSAAPTCAPSLGHRAVRPLRAGNTVLAAARRRRRGPDRRGDRPRRRAVHRRQRPVTPGSTRTPAPSWRWPRPTATSRSPVPCRSR